VPKELVVDDREQRIEGRRGEAAWKGTPEDPLEIIGAVSSRALTGADGRAGPGTSAGGAP
jgi:hypothetical protein